MALDKNMDQDFSDDLEKFEFYLDGEFEFIEELLFSNLVKRPQKEDLSALIVKLKKHEIEKLYNHFHMSAITFDLKKQREYATKLWEKWRADFDASIDKNHLVIEVFDDGSETTVYVFQNPEIH